MAYRSSLFLKNQVDQNPTGLINTCKIILEDFVEYRKSRTGHVAYYFKCGQLDDEILNTLGPDNNIEILIRNLTWSVAEKYIPFFSETWLDKFNQCELSLNELQNAILRIDDTFNFNLEHINNCDFQKSGKFSSDQIKIFKYCLFFYTGLRSEDNNRTLAYDIKDAFINQENSSHLSHELFLINSGIIQAIRVLPLYWGYCVRCVELKSEDLAEYKVGTAITWIQFSSSSEGIKPISNFSKRNTCFIIKSISGRKISKYAKYKHESEVIFLPYSHFLVYKTKMKSNKHLIFLKQIELGIGKSNVLWVDDKIFDDSGENKVLIEKVLKKNPYIKIIQKESTELALSYLESYWGQIKKETPGNFRILTDLNRPQEFDGNRAGARLLWNAINMGFTCDMMVFTSNKEVALQALNDYYLTDFNIQVTEYQIEAINFMSFTNNILD